MKKEELENLKAEVEASMKSMLGDKLRKVILYGSYARGDYDEESDVDFAVITTVPNEKISDFNSLLGEILFQISLKYDIIVTIILVDEKYFAKYEKALPFYANLVKEGQAIYGRS